MERVQTVSKVINLIQQAILPALKGAKIVVDATAGNGNDTLFLAQHTPDDAKIYAFDVQTEALQQTRQLTADFSAKIEYVLRSHAELDEVVAENIDMAMFNLGYLPGQEHELTTVWESTQIAVTKVLRKLVVQGICVIVAYPGHAAGKEEAMQLEAYLQRLSKREYTVGCYRLLNHAATAPNAFVIEKTR